MSTTIETMFLESGAILKGHFKLSSGKHSGTYFEKFRILERPQYLGPCCEQLAERFAESQVELVAGPTVGGVLIAYEVARHLKTNAIYIEREGEKRALRRGASFPKGTRVLVVDDVLTTGLSAQEMIDCLRALEAEVVGVGLLVDRSDKPFDFGVRTEALWTTPAESYEPDKCPLCASGIPLTSPGSRHIP